MDIRWYTPYTHWSVWAWQTFRNGFQVRLPREMRHFFALLKVHRFEQKRSISGCRVWEVTLDHPGAPFPRKKTKLKITLPETNSLPLKIGHPKRKLVFQPSIFRCYVSFREGNGFWTPIHEGFGSDDFPSSKRWCSVFQLLSFKGVILGGSSHLVSKSIASNPHL